MGRIARLIWIDEVIWTQFQALHPRQASKVIEDTLRQAVNIKIDVNDDQLDNMRIEKQNLEGDINNLMNHSKELDLKIRAVESRLREKTLYDKKNEKLKDDEIERTMEGIRASGILEDLAERWT